jgi:hypothetical protein
MILGPVIPPKPKPKPKPKPHKIYDSEDYLYTDCGVDLANYEAEEIEIFGYVENEGFAVPENGEYKLQSGETITISDGIVVYVS